MESGSDYIQIDVDIEQIQQNSLAEKGKGDNTLHIDANFPNLYLILNKLLLIIKSLLKIRKQKQVVLKVEVKNIKV